MSVCLYGKKMAIKMKVKINKNISVVIFISLISKPKNAHREFLPLRQADVKFRCGLLIYKLFAFKKMEGI